MEKIQLTRETRNNISKLLTEYGKVVKDKAPTKEGDKIDIDKLQELPETKKIILELKNMGIKSNTELIENGFIAAGMLLRF